MSKLKSIFKELREQQENNEDESVNEEWIFYEDDDNGDLEQFREKYNKKIEKIERKIKHLEPGNIRTGRGTRISKGTKYFKVRNVTRKLSYDIDSLREEIDRLEKFIKSSQDGIANYGRS